MVIRTSGTAAHSDAEHLHSSSDATAPMQSQNGALVSMNNSL